MNAGFDQNQTEFGVFVLPVGLEVLANGNSLLHEVPEVLRDGGSKPYTSISGSSGTDAKPKALTV